MWKRSVQRNTYGELYVLTMSLYQNVGHLNLDHYCLYHASTLIMVLKRAKILPLETSVKNPHLKEGVLDDDIDLEPGDEPWRELEAAIFSRQIGMRENTSVATRPD